MMHLFQASKNADSGRDLVIIPISSPRSVTANFLDTREEAEQFEAGGRLEARGPGYEMVRRYL
jgi:hypothetical protein